MAGKQDSKMPLETDIVIVGGGPVGLAAACCLSGSGLQVILIDAGQQTQTTAKFEKHIGKPDFDSRVSALTVASEKLLDSMGAWALIKELRSCPYRDMQVWDGEGTGAIHFSAADIHENTLGHIVENRLITAALLEQAQTFNGLTILNEKEVEQIDLQLDRDKPVQLKLTDGSLINATLLVGADGAHSLVRDQSGFTLRQWDYGHEAIVTTVKTENPHQFTAWQRFMQTGPLAFLPLFLPGKEDSEQCYSSIVWSCVTERADVLKTLDDEGFKHALGAAFEFRLGDILETGPRISFPLWQRHATVYVQNHIVLIGDAAHTIHPLAGQGVNLGFADVQVLSEVISAALDKGEAYASHQVLSRYQRRRKGLNMGMMAAMEGFKRLFATEDLTLKWLRNTGLNLTDKAPLIKQQIMRQAMGL